MLNKADRLTRRSDHEEGVNLDNSNTTVLDPKVFRINATGRHVTSIPKDLKRSLIKLLENDALSKETFTKIKTLGPRKLTQGLQEWNYEDQLLLFRGKIYVPKDTELRRKLVKEHHDATAAGHPGRWKTYELLQRDYWWPGMSLFVKKYVDGCSTCQSTKNITHPIHVPLIPTENAEEPWKYVSTDFVTDLPEVDGFDSINVVVDKFSKAIVITPCKKPSTLRKRQSYF